MSSEAPTAKPLPLQGLIPLWNRVLIKKIDKVGGLYLPQGIETMGKLQRGEIAAIGDGVRQLKVGDEVYFGLSGTQLDVLSFEGQDYIITPMESVLAKVKVAE